ncbi:MAG: bacteriohopanetetrol glucosamine biosynthesis glycosyltransferase HpnI [Gammaproteobacteria bacterium]|nr:bacteriohopanetetrol glucosamine biosynthesis glycosyltransferase HpnI [Gammaproteobacteria bacterium]
MSAALGALGLACALASAAYLCIAVLAVSRRPSDRSDLSAPPGAVSVLKPLCGVESGTYECLRSFFLQRHPRYQIVFGVQDPADPVLSVLERLEREFPGVAARVVVDPRQHGGNRKVGNLLNMLGAAEHDLLVLADSDIRVPPDYLRIVTAPLADPKVGIVTCAYAGVPRPGLASILGACFVNDWFLPSVRVAAWFGSRAFAFGATIALRRDTLNAIGGFEAVADHLADDYRIGELARGLGLRTVLSELQVETVVEEADFRSLLRHELRWLRTIRLVQPWGYALSGVTFGVPFALLGVLLSAGRPAALACAGIAAAARFVLHWQVRVRGAPPWHWLALPLGDSLSFVLWCFGFAARSVRWREGHYRVGGDGSLRRNEDFTR